MREKREKLSFLFGVDDHWGPLHMYEEVCDELYMLCLNLFVYRNPNMCSPMHSVHSLKQNIHL